MPAVEDEDNLSRVFLTCEKSDLQAGAKRGRQCGRKCIKTLSTSMHTDTHRYSALLSRSPTATTDQQSATSTNMDAEGYSQSPSRWGAKISVNDALDWYEKYGLSIESFPTTRPAEVSRHWDRNTSRYTALAYKYTEDDLPPQWYVWRMPSEPTLAGAKWDKSVP